MVETFKNQYIDWDFRRYMVDLLGIIPVRLALGLHESPIYITQLFVKFVTMMDDNPIKRRVGNANYMQFCS